MSQLGLSILQFLIPILLASFNAFCQFIFVEQGNGLYNENLLKYIIYFYHMYFSLLSSILPLTPPQIVLFLFPSSPSSGFMGGCLHICTCMYVCLSICLCVTQDPQMSVNIQYLPLQVWLISFNDFRNIVKYFSLHLMF